MIFEKLNSTHLMKEYRLCKQSRIQTYRHLSHLRALVAFIFFLMILLLQSCGKAIIIRDAVLNDPVYPMFGQIPQRSFFADTVLGDSLILKWDTDVNGGFANTSIVCFKDYIFVPDLSGRVYAFKISDGKQIGYISEKGAVSASPIINQYKFIFALARVKDNESTIFNYDFKQGKVASKADVKGRVLTEMIRLSDNFVFCTENGKVFSYSYGLQQKWEYDSESFLHSSPVYAANSIIFGNDKGEVLAVGAQSGTEKYRITMGSGFEGGFAASNDSVFCADKNGILYCFNAEDGKIFWKFKSGARVTSCPVTKDNFIYFGNVKGDIFKLNKTGSQIWKISTGSIINTTPLLCSDILVQPDYNKKVYLIDLVSGKILNSMYFDDRVKLSPVFYKGILFIGTDNDIYAYEKFSK